MPEPTSVGFDLGGTNLRACRVGPDGQIQARARRPTGAGDGPDAIVGRIADAFVEIDDGTVDAVGVACPGPLDPVTGVVHQAPNLPGWDGFELADAIRWRLGMARVSVLNDATAYAVGEARFGAGRGARVVVCVTLGTGVGGGIVIDGEPLHGASGGAGEFGHVTLDPAGVRCGCGKVGCAETLCSATAVVRMARERMGADAPADARAVAERARSGDARAREVIDIAGTGLGVMIGLIANTVSPDRIVIGGGLAGAWDLMGWAAIAAAEKHAFASNLAACQVVVGTLGDDAGALGAAAAIPPAS